MLLTTKERLPYQVGGLLYFPATKQDMYEKIKAKTIRGLSSAAFCLEDAIRDSSLELAERTLKETLHRFCTTPVEDAPLLFVRVRTPEHLCRVHRMLGEDAEALTGYILPKFDLTNARAYLEFFNTVNEKREKPLYLMPILESEQIANLSSRIPTLLALRELLDPVRSYVLNIRVGGNDFCNLYGVRRGIGQTVYEVGVVRDILTDIVNVFSRDYVVSGPVWEYFDGYGGTEWMEGLRKETELDKLNGFIGKTAIHPSQLPVIREALRVSKEDYDDAVSLLNWKSGLVGVEKSPGGRRMNEQKCHEKWAEKILCLASIYGVKDE